MLTAGRIVANDEHAGKIVKASLTEPDGSLAMAAVLHGPDGWTMRPVFSAS